MAKTYTAPTTVSAGDAITASLYNTYVGTNVANLIVPPAVRVYRSSNLTGYTNMAAITWNAEDYDTDSMYSTGTTVTINTAGLYLVTFNGYFSSTGATRILQRVAANGTTFLGSELTLDGGGGSTFTASTVRNFAATTTITSFAQFVGGSAYVIQGSATDADAQTALSLTWIGRTS